MECIYVCVCVCVCVFVDLYVCISIFQVQNAEKYGAKGMILYSDPADYAVPQKVDPYPNSWWLPGSGVQRGSLAILGDPLTPGYPANGEYVEKIWLPDKKAQVIPY